MERKSAIPLIISGIVLMVLGVNFYYNELPLIAVTGLTMFTGLLIAVAGAIELNVA